MANAPIEFNDIAQLKNSLQMSNSFFNMDKTIKDLLDTGKIEKITRIRETELDDIAVMFYFGIRHTAILNLLSNPKSKNVYYANIDYNKLEISSILDYVLINLSMRLSHDSKSRIEIENMITALVKNEVEKMLKEKEQGILGKK